MHYAIKLTKEIYNNYLKNTSAIEQSGDYWQWSKTISPSALTWSNIVQF